MSMLAPAMHRVDRPHLLPPLKDLSYPQALLELAEQQKIDLLIPTIDSELLIVAQQREALRDRGCTAVISSVDVVRICGDKIITHRLLMDSEIDTPATWTHDAALKKARYRFPYFLKPRTGSAGKGTYRISNVDELHAIARRVPDPIVQEFVVGPEYTLDVYTGFDGVPRCVVPRRRLEVRSGEVSKGVVEKNQRIMAVGRRVVRALGDCRGVITVQCIVDPKGRIRVIEINPRFGGGAPLGIAAGADFPLWLMAEYVGRPVDIDPDGFRDNVVMLRYDQSVFCDHADL